MIKELSISNYKSFSEKKISLNRFNVLVGANSVGKSNLIDSLKFIQSAVLNGLTYTIRKRYGWSGIKCRKTYKHHIEFCVLGDFSEDYPIFKIKKNIELLPQNYVYSFKFSEKEKFRYLINNEAMRVEIIKKKSKENLEEETVSKFLRSEKEEKIQVEESFLEREQKREMDIPKQLEERLFLNTRFMCLGSVALSDYIERWRFYKLDPETIRNPIIEEEADYVSERGDTLALILNKLEKSENPQIQNIKNKMLNIMTMLVPDFEKLITEELSDGRITFKIKERKTSGLFTPTQISDGTLHLLGLLVVLLYYKEKPTLICIEEPERNIHPMALQEIVDLMRQVSKHIQIFVTTHSPYLVRFCRPEEVLLADKINGVTEIVRVNNIDKIDEFLEDFAIDELWLQKYLGRGTPL